MEEFWIILGSLAGVVTAAVTIWLVILARRPASSPTSSAAEPTATEEPDVEVTVANLFETFEQPRDLGPWSFSVSGINRSDHPVRFTSAGFDRSDGTQIVITEQPYGADLIRVVPPHDSGQTWMDCSLGDCERKATRPGVPPVGRTNLAPPGSETPRGAKSRRPKVELSSSVSLGKRASGACDALALGTGKELRCKHSVCAQHRRQAAGAPRRTGRRTRPVSGGACEVRDSEAQSERKRVVGSRAVAPRWLRACAMAPTRPSGSTATIRPSGRDNVPSFQAYPSEDQRGFLLPR